MTGIPGKNVKLYDGETFAIPNIIALPVDKSLSRVRDLIERTPKPGAHDLFDTNFHWTQHILETELAKIGLVNSSGEYTTPPDLMHEITEFGRFLHLEKHNEVNYTNGARPVPYLATMAYLSADVIGTERGFERPDLMEYRESAIKIYEDYATRRSQFALEAMDYELTPK